MKKRTCQKVKESVCALAVIGLASAGEVLAQNPADATASSGVIGFQRITPGEGWRAVGPPLEPFPAARAVLIAAQEDVVSLDLGAEAGPWVVNQWAGYELAVKSGLGAGRLYPIRGNGPDWLALGRGSDPSADGVLAGDEVSISPTLEEYLGGQMAGGALNSSDWVATFYRNALIKLYRHPTGQWLDEKDNPARLTVACGRGFLVNLTAGNDGPRWLLLTGEWNGDSGASYIAGGQQIISVPLHGGPLALESVLGDRTDPFGRPGGRPVEGDQLTVFNELDGDYRTCGLDETGQWRWQDTSESAGGLLIEPGRGYLYDHTGPGFSWFWR